MRSVFDTLDVVDFNMTVKVANLGSAIGGKTEFNILDSNFNVTVNSYFDDATDLAVVGTLIHEAFHCQLLDWYRTVMLNGDTVKRNYLALNYGYLFSKETTDYNNHLAAIIYGAQGASQHQDIATRYRNTIGETIYQYALSKGINVSLNYCKKLAWTGCQDSKAYLDLTQQEKDELTDIINAEKDPLGNNVNTSLKPFKGSPCL